MKHKTIAELLENAKEIIAEHYPEAAYIITFSFIKYVSELITKAKQSIYIANFNVSGAQHEMYPFWLKVFNKAQQNIPVTLLVNTRFGTNKAYTRQQDAIQFIRNHGVNVVEFPPSRILHLKTIIIDDYHTIIGSHNLTYENINRSINISVHIKSTTLAIELRNFINNIIETVKEEQKIRAAAGDRAGA